LLPLLVLLVQQGLLMLHLVLWYQQTLLVWAALPVQHWYLSVVQRCLVAV
jgi:hypothetical protein